MKKLLGYTFVLIVLLLSVKVDYRLISDISCCKDDHDYYSHAETIAEDFDFDYDNQFQEKPNQRYYVNGKQAPSGFVGSGLLSSPFIYVGNLLNKLFVTSSIFNFKILLYSFSSIFYLYLTFRIFTKINLIINTEIKNIFLLIVLLGSGVSYYALERYSMTPVYEIFTSSLIIYISLKLCKNPEQNIFYALLPILILGGVLVKWVHLYYIFIPFIVKESLYIFLGYEKVKIYFNKYFLGSSLISIATFLTLSKLIYGQILLNPETVYNTSGFVSSYFNDQTFAEFFINAVKNSFIILFTQEFGLFWFNSVLFLGLLLSLLNYFKKLSKNNISLYLVSFISYAQIFGIVLMWQSTASAYGFRYLLNLVPLALFQFLIFFKKTNYLLFKNYLYIFSIFGFISVVFFEGNGGTQLAITPIENSFGRVLPFTQPEYLTGLIKSFVDINVYLKIFTTSFLGLIFFKLLILVDLYGGFVSTAERFNLPIQNQDFIIYVEQVNLISTFQLLVFVLLLVFISIGIYRNIYVSK